jgi:hypothetical protein
MSFGRNNKTPAPTRPAAPAPREKDAATSYGQSGFSQASSVMPGQRVVSQLAANIEATNGDDMLAAIIGNKGKYATDVDVADGGPKDGRSSWQVRPVSAKPMKPSENMKADPNASGSPSGKA